jgi:hypothetical protein
VKQDLVACTLSINPTLRNTGLVNSILTRCNFIAITTFKLNLLTISTVSGYFEDLGLGSFILFN